MEILKLANKGGDVWFEDVNAAAVLTVANGDWEVAEVGLDRAEATRMRDWLNVWLEANTR